MTAVKSKAAATAKLGRKRDAAATRQALVEAAAVVFKSGGYFNTDTNAIARQAGYAPGSFYKHFSDKAAILLAVYETYAAEEWAGLAAAVAGLQKPIDRLKAGLSFLAGHHATWAQFRTDIRTVAALEPGVEAALAANRNRQLDALAELTGLSLRRDTARLVLIRTIAQRLSEAIEDGKAQGIKPRAILEAAEVALHPLIR